MDNSPASHALIKQISQPDVDQLLAEDRLLRVLTPALQALITKTLTTNTEGAQHLMQCNGTLYFSFVDVADAQERTRLVNLLRRYQLGEPVTLDALPAELRRLVQPNLTQTGRLLGAVLMGAVAGFVVGVLAMAICILLINILELLSSAIILEIAGMGITAVTFIIFSTLGWAAATLVAWRRLRHHLPLGIR
ncbi:MAG: hypothetical protein KC425_21045 [Anaerolineales bacterium]|nr:hypothetical protein [Anaerolineales bacterium]